MLGTLPTHAKKNWQEWMATLTHAYNCTVSSVTGFSPYFLMLQARLKWAYQKAQENNRKESERQNRYYDQKMKCMSLKPEDIVLVHVKAPSGQHKIIDQWENKQY